MKKSLTGKIKYLTVLAGVLAAAALFGCGEKETEPPTEEITVQETVEENSSSAQIVKEEAVIVSENSTDFSESGDASENSKETADYDTTASTAETEDTNIKEYTVPGTEFTFDATGIEGQPYLVAVNRIMNTVTVYGKDENGNYTDPISAFICSVGSASTGTPIGRYVTEERYEWRLMVDGTYARDAIRVWRGIMFHSVGYYSEHADDLEYDEFNKLGSAASLGCIRLCYRDISWLYNNCPEGFVTIIYDDETSAGPLGQPKIEQIDTTDEEMRGWDPTDPEKPNGTSGALTAADVAKMAAGK